MTMQKADRARKLREYPTIQGRLVEGQAYMCLAPAGDWLELIYVGRMSLRGMVLMAYPIRPDQERPVTCAAERTSLRALLG